jgi:transitional endoplasmic reticulum ATPase
MATKSTVSADVRSALDALEKAGGKLTAEDDVIFRGTQLVIPERMTLGDAARFIHTKIEEEDRMMAFSRQYRFRPWDGARATMSALKRVFGMTGQKGFMKGSGFFASWQPPELVTIPTGVGKTEQVPWGGLEIPVLPGVLFQLDFYIDDEYGPLFQISCEAPRKHRHAVEGVFNVIDAELATNSLYRGQAFDGQVKPEFIDTAAVDRTKIVYATGAKEQLEANVWSLLRHSQKMRDLNIPLKRTVLLEGPYGTGKTVGATITAQEAVANGWTFVYCRPGRDDVAQVMATARLYQPAVVFVEDVDTITNPESETHDGVARLLDLFDGITAKDTEILVVMTTNHAEKIHKGMLRPGRLDSVIHIGALDSHGVEQLTKVLVPAELLDEGIEWELVGTAMDGFLPAFIKEAVDRAQRYNLARNNGEPGVLTTDDLVNSALGLRSHLALMEDAQEIGSPDPLSVAFRKAMGQVVDETGFYSNSGVTADGQSVSHKLTTGVKE